MGRLLVATTNEGKLAEVRGLLEGLPVELVTLASVGPLPPPEESGRTFEENARAKALYYAARTGLLTVAEDSGLEIDALDGAPGVESARYGGPNASYAEKFRLIHEALRARGAPADSPARFVCAVAVADGNRVTFEARGTLQGRIAAEPRGLGGFGYDAIFFVPPLGCTLAEAAGRKATVSHRAKAFGDLKRFLAETG